MRKTQLALVSALLLGLSHFGVHAQCSVGMQDCTVSGTVTLGGRATFRTVTVTAGSKLQVPVYNGIDAVNTGNLEITCDTLIVEAGATISARASGFYTESCTPGRSFKGNAAYTTIPRPAAGGCMVRDSGSGGGLYGQGGIGTQDCLSGCSLPSNFPDEISCVDTRDYSKACTDASCCTNSCNCRNDVTCPPAGTPGEGEGYRFNIYDVSGGAGFGGSGGDKGCRDGDGRNSKQGGSGGGRLFFNCSRIEIRDGATLTAEGGRGCGNGNDSAGGGAGGTIALIADDLTVGTAALISVAGGLGGDTKTKNLTRYPECTGTQLDPLTSGVCDDCGGGGAGGIIYMVARTGNVGQTINAWQLVSYGTDSRFFVDGALGGACSGCNFESRGQNGRVFLTSSAATEQICNSGDDNYDGITNGVKFRDGALFPYGGRYSASECCDQALCAAYWAMVSTGSTGTTGSTGVPLTTVATVASTTAATATTAATTTTATVASSTAASSTTATAATASTAVTTAGSTATTGTTGSTGVVWTTGVAIELPIAAVDAASSLQVSVAVLLALLVAML